MKVHHLNCGTMVFGTVDHCLLIETPESGLVLVDTGFGQRCVEDAALLGWSRHVIRPVLRQQETALRQVQSLGFDPSDVQHVVLTHLDYDHTGGLADFPWATVHVHGPEYRASLDPTGLDRIRYRTDQMCRHGVKWAVNEVEFGGSWFGFDAVRDLPGLPPEILVIPLYGHSRGHVGVAVDAGERWLLHAGDAYLHSTAISSGAVGAASRVSQVSGPLVSDRRAQLRNMRRLADLASRCGDEIAIINSHDRAAFISRAGESVRQR